MANDLAVIENMLTPLAPRFDAVLAPSGMDSKRLIQSIVVSCERLPILADPEQVNRQTVINAAMSAACLGLEVDGYTGQAFIIPFKGKAQLVIGYKGFNTQAARSGFIIAGAAVYEDDAFAFDVGSGGVSHRYGGGDRGRLIATWAQGRHRDMPPLTPSVLYLDELMAVKAKSPGARKSDSPWNDPKVGFPAMCEKTAKRRQARGMPLNVMQLGAAMDTHYEELGKYSRVDPVKGLVVAGEVVDASPLPQRQGPDEAPPLSLEKPVYKVSYPDGSDRVFEDATVWRAFIVQGFGKIREKSRLTDFKARNEANLTAAEGSAYDTVQAIEAAYDERLTQLQRADRTETAS